MLSDSERSGRQHSLRNHGIKARTRGRRPKVVRASLQYAALCGIHKGEHAEADAASGGSTSTRRRTLEWAEGMYWERQIPGCAKCRNLLAGPSKCSRCHTTAGCGQACQSRDVEEHGPTCKTTNLAKLICSRLAANHQNRITSAIYIHPSRLRLRFSSTQIKACSRPRGNAGFVLDLPLTGTLDFSLRMIVPSDIVIEDDSQIVKS